MRAAPLWVGNRAPGVWSALIARTAGGRDGYMRRVLVDPIGVTVEVAEGRTLLDAITNAAVSVPTDCRGRGVCGKCLVRLGAGEVTPPTSADSQCNGRKVFHPQMQAPPTAAAATSARNSAVTHGRFFRADTGVTFPASAIGTGRSLPTCVPVRINFCVFAGATGTVIF